MTTKSRSQMKTKMKSLKQWEKLNQQWKALCEKHGLDDVLLLVFDDLYDVAGTAREYRSMGFNFLYYKKRVPVENALLFRHHGAPKSFTSASSPPIPCYPYGRLGSLITFAWQHLTLEGLSNTPFDDAHILFNSVLKDLKSLDLPERTKISIKRLESLLSNPQYSLASYEYFVKHVLPSPDENISKFVIYWKDSFHDAYYTDFVNHLLGDGVLITLNWLGLELSADEHLKLIINLRDTLPINNWKEQIRKGISNDDLTGLLLQIIRTTFTLLHGDGFKQKHNTQITRLLQEERLFNGYLFNASKLPLYFQKSLHVSIYNINLDEDDFFSEEKPVILLSPYEINQLETQVIAAFIDKNKEYFNQDPHYQMQYYAGPFEHVNQL